MSSSVFTLVEVSFETSPENVSFSPWEQMDKHCKTLHSSHTLHTCEVTIVHKAHE